MLLKKLSRLCFYCYFLFVLSTTNVLLNFPTRVVVAHAFSNSNTNTVINNIQRGGGGNGSNGSNGSGRVLVVGGGTIGCGFAAVFLAQGKTVVCSDSFLGKGGKEIIESRISSIWGFLEARGLGLAAKSPRGGPPFEKLSFESNLQKAIESGSGEFELVQECIIEDIPIKQQILKQLDDALPSKTLIASSTSFIPLELLTAKCTCHPCRILIAHPTIPHVGSFLEICGSASEEVERAKQWYTHQAGFDCITLQKSVPGHVYNSFLSVVMGHGEQLIKDGVCSPQDVNTCLRHFGRELYCRNMFLALNTVVGGEQGLKGGLDLTDKIGTNAIGITFSSNFKWLPFNQQIGKWIANNFKNQILPPPPPQLLEAFQRMEDCITQNGLLNVQEGVLRISQQMYKQTPLEVHNDPMKLPFQGFYATTKTSNIKKQQQDEGKEREGKQQQE